MSLSTIVQYRIEKEVPERPSWSLVGRTATLEAARESVAFRKHIEKDLPSKGATYHIVRETLEHLETIP